MELWTVQDERVYDSFLVRGLPYRVETEHTWPYDMTESGLPDSAIHPYRWMARQLASKVGPAPDGVEFPVWAWKKVDGHDNGKPDMRGWRTTYVEKVVRLKLELDESRVLLSDYDSWHIPLNLGYFGKSEAETDEFDKWLADNGIARFKNGIWSDVPLPIEAEARRKIEESWSRCLELEPTPQKGYDPDWVGNWADDYIQGVFWEIRPEDVVSVERFTTRLHAGAKEVQAREAARRNGSRSTDN